MFVVVCLICIGCWMSVFVHFLSVFLFFFVCNSMCLFFVLLSAVISFVVVDLIIFVCFDFSFI